MTKKKNNKTKLPQQIMQAQKIRRKIKRKRDDMLLNDHSFNYFINTFIKNQINIKKYIQSIKYTFNVSVFKNIDFNFIIKYLFMINFFLLVDIKNCLDSPLK